MPTLERVFALCRGTDACADEAHRRPCFKRKFDLGRRSGKSSRAFVLTCNLPCLLTLTQPLIIQICHGAAVSKRVPAAWPGRAGRI